jgi:hypothetical protein
MNTIISFLQAHSTIATLVAYYVAISFTGSLPAPTAQSGMFYKFIFSFVNTLAGNLARAYSTKVEGSPNFQAAVNALPGPVDKPVVIVETPKV